MPPPFIDPKRVRRQNYSDGTFDEPYDGLDIEYERETLSQSELKRLKFIRWSRRHKKPHFLETLSVSEPETD